jgi:hypothetical protein
MTFLCVEEAAFSNYSASGMFWISVSAANFRDLPVRPRRRTIKSEISGKRLSVSIPSVHPTLTDHAACRGSRLNDPDKRFGWLICNFLNDLSSVRFGELIAFEHRQQKCFLPTDESVPVVEAQVVHVAEASWALEHDRQTVDDDALGNRFVPSLHDTPPATVRSVPSDVDHFPNRFDARFVKQLVVTIPCR